MTKEQVFVALEALGATKVVAGFSGGNDEGGWDVIQFYNGETLLDVEFDIYDEAHGFSAGENKLRHAIATYLDSWLDGQYGGFGGDFSVSGELTIDTITRTAIVTGSERSDYTSFERSL